MSGRGVTADMLRQMIAVLQDERQALAGMDLDTLLATAADKQTLCEGLEAANDDDAAVGVDAECAALLAQAKQLNEVNRQVRNLLARNVAARLDALAGTSGTYSMRARTGPVAASL